MSLQSVISDVTHWTSSAASSAISYIGDTIDNFSFSNAVANGFSAFHSFSDVFGTYSFGVSNLAMSSFEIFGNKKSTSGTAGFGSSDSYWYDVGSSNGYVTNFLTGAGVGAGVLNFVSTNISEYRRESDFLNFHMGDGTSFQVQNSSNEDEAVQFSMDGENVSGAKIGYADQDNNFTYDSGVTVYCGSSEGIDVLHVESEPGEEIWLDGSDGNTYSNINAIDASGSTGDNILAGSEDNVSITGGSGSDSMWGGSGGDDTLIGGAGDNTYFYGNNGGNDVIINSVATDSVNLYDVSLTDIVSAGEVGQDFVVNMRGGNSLVIQGQQGASNFILANQEAYSYSRESHTWTRTN